MNEAKPATTPSLEPWLRLQIECLQLAWTQAGTAGDVAKAARGMATEIAPIFGIPVPGQQLPGVPAPGMGEAPTSDPSSPFGPAFKGWDTPTLYKILSLAQQIVIGRTNGAQDEQIRPVRDEIDKAIDALQEAWLSRQAGA